MITGNEPINPSEVQIELHTGKVNQNFIAQGVHTASGITFKQHMVVEFTKALLSNSGITNMNTLGADHWKALAVDSISVANEVIKQLNDEDK